MVASHAASPKNPHIKSRESISRSYEMPFGPVIQPGGAGVLFRLWAPSVEKIQLFLPETDSLLPMQADGNGWFSALAPQTSAKTQYQFQLEDGLRVPDPASRYQPQDVHGPSQVIDPAQYEWRDANWQGRPWEEAVLYELHVGTFTPEGTFQAAKGKLDYLVELGVTAIELMPVADFSGSRSWGYDGVLPYAPDSRYGTPEDLKDLIDAAHRKGLMVFLDVVYNHFGPDGNYLHCYAKQFFDESRHTPWGAAINFQGPREVREFFIHNALFWLQEYHFDGLRLDAVHAIQDESEVHVLEELAARVHQAIPEGRHVHLVLENDDNCSRWLNLPNGRYTAQWNDDFHHAAHVIATGDSSGYYSDYALDNAIEEAENATGGTTGGTESQAQDEGPESARRSPVAFLARCLTEGFAYQGEFSPYREEERGERTTGLPLTAFVDFLQNHDQIGNRAFGERLNRLAPPEAIRALWEIMLLAPAIPMLFMGEEWQAGSPFLYFCDFNPELNRLVTEGRRNEFARFPEFSDPEVRERIPDPCAISTFEESRLRWEEHHLPEHREWLALCRRLLGIRQREIVPRLSGIRVQPTRQAGPADCNVFQRTGLSARWPLAEGGTLQLLANLGSMPLTLPVRLFDNRDLARHDLLYQSCATAAKLLKSSQLPAWSVIWLVC
jgi:1,4-alpha-glucan branching enzyme